MALAFAHGAIQWLAADAATTVYTVSGLSFQPKAIRFYWMGLGSAVDAAATQTIRRGIGFAASTSDRRCVGSEDINGAGSMTCTSGYRTDAVAMTLTSTPAADGLLDLNSITADGFTLIVDDQAPVDVTVFWEAWGGTDITNVATGEISEPAATGDQSYTIGFTPSVVLTAGIQATGGAPTAVRADSGLSVGFTVAKVASQATVVGNQDDGSANADTDGGLRKETLMMIPLGGGAMDALADWVSMDATGFTLNWSARATTGRKSIYLAIAGGGWDANDDTIDGSTIGATVTISGLPFTPIGVCLVGRMTAAQVTGGAEDRIGLGTASSTSSRRTQGCLSVNGGGSANTNLVVEYDQALAFPSSAGALQTAYDISAFNSDGFQVITDVAGGVASEYFGWLTFGDAPTGRIFKLAGEGGGLVGPSRGLAA
jgi:hypothetical protein